MGPGREVAIVIREFTSHNESQDFFLISISIRPMKTKPPPKAHRLAFKKRKKISVSMAYPLS